MRIFPGSRSAGLRTSGSIHFGSNKTAKVKIGVRALAGLLILREKVIRPVLAGIYKPRPGRPPKILDPIDIHYQDLQREMYSLSSISHLPPETTRQHAVVKITPSA